MRWGLGGPQGWMSSMSQPSIKAGMSSYALYLLQHESRVSPRTMSTGGKAFLGKRLCLSPPHPQGIFHHGSVEWAWLVGMELFWFWVFVSILDWPRLEGWPGIIWVALSWNQIHRDALASTSACWDHRQEQSSLVSVLVPQTVPY